MKALAQRAAELRVEHARGRAALADVQRQERDLTLTLARIEGALQIIEAIERDAAEASPAPAAPTALDAGSRDPAIAPGAVPSPG